jgi:hypothetical protein
MRKNPGFKIILGLLFPPTIAKLEFKTREELELMPQTEEELQVRFSNCCSFLKAACCSCWLQLTNNIIWYELLKSDITDIITKLK